MNICINILMFFSLFRKLQNELDGYFRDSIRATIERYKNSSSGNANTHSVQEINAAVLLSLHLPTLI